MLTTRDSEIKKQPQETSVIIAVNTANLEMLKELIGAKADLNVVNEKGHTALHLLVYHLTGEAPIPLMREPIQFTELLLKAGAVPDKTCEDVYLEDRACPWTVVFPGDPDWDLQEIRTNKTALEIATSRLNAEYPIWKLSIPNRQLLENYHDLIKQRMTELRHERIKLTLTFFTRIPDPITSIVNGYDVHDTAPQMEQSSEVDFSPIFF